GRAGGRDGASADEAVELVTQSIEGAALAADHVRRVGHLVGVEPEAEVARGCCPGLVGAANLEWAIHQLLDAWAEARRWAGDGHGGERGAEGDDGWGDLVPVAQFEGDEGAAGEHEERRCTDYAREQRRLRRAPAPAGGPRRSHTRHPRAGCSTS